MFCYQCEQASNSKACTKMAYAARTRSYRHFRPFNIFSQGLSLQAVEARKAGIVDQDLNIFTIEAFFSTLTM